MRKMLIIGMGILFLCSGALSATIINIPSEYLTIQQGIDASLVADTVLVQPGTYIENINYNGKNITVASLFLTSADTSYISQTIIDGNQSGSVVTFESGEDTTAVLSGFTVQNGNADEGGGIDLGHTNCSFENVIIKDNYSNIGGGISGWISDIYFSKTSIKNNHAYDHYGGIYCFNTPISFDPIELSNIYSNTANHKGSGIDIFTNLIEPLSIIVDTFTVINPTDHYASPIDQFYFSIIHGKQDSLVNADLYVSVDGDNSNSGLSADEPLKNIKLALSKIYADSTHNNKIFLSPGVYSHYTNGENFPLEMTSYVTMTGSNPEEVILDADTLSSIINFINVPHGQIYNMTLQNGEATRGGGIYIRNSNPIIRNVILRYNHAEEGGAIYSGNNSHPMIINSTFHHNSSSDDGGALYCDDISLNQTMFYRNSVGDYGIICFDQPSASSQIQNITMVNNTGLAMQVNTGYLKILNSILWNDGYTEIWGSYTNDIYVSYSDIQGGYSGTGNISTYPLFNDPSNDDYHLKWTNFPYSDSTKSPCIDKGSPVTMYNDPDGTRNDMGWEPYYQTPYGTISGQVALNGPFGSVDEVLITVDTMFTFPDEDGLYTLPIWAGNYNVTASHCRYQDSVQINVPVLEWTNTNDINFVLQLTHQGPVWHIATDGSDSTGTGSFQHPFFSIQLGIDMASDNDTILIHPGVYHECINYNEKAITVASEFIVDHDSSYIYQTVVDGDSLGRVVAMTNSDTNYQYLSGLTIENGYHSSGAGICCMNSNSILSNLIIQECTAQFDGGGILLASTQAEISKVKILSCSADNKGGGMRTALSSAVVENMSLINCGASYGGAIYDNNSNIKLSKLNVINCEAQEYGGAFFFLLSEITLNNSILNGNLADSLGGVLYTHSSDMYIANSMLNNNSASIGGGIYSVNSDYDIINSTLYGNDNIGIYCENQSEMNVINDILWQNNSQQIEANNSNVTVEYSDIEGGFIGTGNINENPQFIDSINNNFHLLENSPCINSGTPDTTGLHLPPWDLDGNPRIYDSRIDMSAYEWQGVAIDDTVFNYTIPTLHQNFPNPFSTSTKISFSLPHPDKVKIQIYNLKGQLVETLLNENKPAGNYTFEWNAENASSGIYFCKLSTNKTSSIQKLVIIK